MDQKAQAMDLLAQAVMQIENETLRGTGDPTRTPTGLLAAHPRLNAIAGGLTFRFIEFNPRRASRGAPAARVEVLGDGCDYWLWMTPRDIRKNIAAHGDCAELQKALNSYKGKVLS